jgi:molecular chaperone DnaK (HSP70)
LKKKIILPSVLALAVLATILTTTNVTAQDLNNYPPIVQKIADRFNLDADEVEQVFDEDRDEQRAAMFAYFADRLDDLVDEERLTESQKNAILDKHEEVQNAMEEYGDLSKEERREKMQNIHNEFKVWLKNQGFEDGLLRELRK